VPPPRLPAGPLLSDGAANRPDAATAGCPRRRQDRQDLEHPDALRRSSREIKRHQRGFYADPASAISARTSRRMRDDNAKGELT